MFRQNKEKELDERRTEVLSFIRAEQWRFEKMQLRAQMAGDEVSVFLASIPEHLREFEQKATLATSVADLDDLENIAEGQGRFRAYLCPRAEIKVEGTLAFNQMEEWNVPKSAMTKLRLSLGETLERADTDPCAARGALLAIFLELDAWADYTSQYEDTMQRFSRWWLFCPAVGALILSIFGSLHPQWFPLVLTILLAGAAGSCVSVLMKLPVLEVSLAHELDSYERRILSRVGVGMIASLIGSGLLGWGLLPFSLQGQTFGDVLNACSSSCTGPHSMILLAIPLLFGFSERALDIVRAERSSEARSRKLSEARRAPVGGAERALVRLGPLWAPLATI